MESLSNSTTPIIIKVSSDTQTQRLDIFLSNYFKDSTRSFIKKLIEQERVLLNDKEVKKSGILIQPQDIITIKESTQIQHKNSAKDLPIKVIHEHPDFLVIYKPAGIMTHKPHPSSPDNTVSEWAVAYNHEILSVGDPLRPGIVHRLDKDTSGLLIIPKTPEAHSQFQSMFKNRLIQKEYIAIVLGHPLKEGKIESLIVRHPKKRTEMTTSTTAGRESSTHFKVVKYLEDAALVKALPVTGRTHQIRVHFKSIDHPILGDKLYNHKNTLPNKIKKILTRQALHAYKLSFTFHGKQYSFCSDIPEDMNKVIKVLKLKDSYNSDTTISCS